VPVEAVVKAGYEVVFADPRGNEPTMDAGSDLSRYFGGDDGRRDRAKAFLKDLVQLRHPRSFYDVLHEGLDGYVGVYVPGGHAPMEDLATNTELGRILRVFHDRGKPTALLCHGPVALLSTLESPERALGGRATRARRGKRGGRNTGDAGDWPYRGYKLTVFSSDEERSAEDRMLGGRVRFMPEKALRSAGARVEVTARGAAHVIIDRELVTGQNPQSDAELTAAFLRLLAHP
jgi:putative intracellular protease/amidase